MITRKTVFVVGAGGSMPYGLPSGASLLNAAKSIDPEMLRTKILQNAELYEARSFCTTVSNSQSDSLDALLEHRIAPDLF